MNGSGGGECGEYRDASTAGYYSGKAADLADKYAETSPGFASLLQACLPEGSRVFDAGCGSGRDLAEVMAAGFDAYGADASAEMLAQAVQRHPVLAGRVVRSGLPVLKGVAGPYDGLLCSAVLQHLPDALIPETFMRFSSLLNPSGILILTVPKEYPDADPVEKRDKGGRVFILRPESVYADHASAAGFALKETRTRKNRTESGLFVWTTQIFRKDRNFIY